MMYNAESINLLCVVSSAITDLEICMINKHLCDKDLHLEFVSEFDEIDLFETIDLSLIDGVICFGGEEDISPSFYGEQNNFSKNININRDKFEYTLCQYVAENSLPFLGICRGMQMMNIVLGGQLFQDVPHNVKHAGNWLEFYRNSKQSLHGITIVEGTKLFSILNKKDITVNSYHHQGISKIADCLIASAYGDDGLIESIEHPIKPIIGIQWHAELMDDGNSHNLFNAFINILRRKKSNGSIL